MRASALDQHAVLRLRHLRAWLIAADFPHGRDGHAFAAAGAVTVLGTLLLPPHLAGGLLVTATAAAVGVPTVYSYVAWARDARQGPSRRS